MSDKEKETNGGRTGDSGDGGRALTVTGGPGTLSVVSGGTAYPPATRTVAPTAGDGESAGNRSRTAGAVRPPIGAGPRDAASPAKPAARAIGQPDDDDAGAGEAGIRGRVDGDPGDSGGTPERNKRGRPRRKPDVGAPETVDR